jgi:formate hydrogenlyase transcriptional activator
VLSGLLEALVSMLKLDFAYGRLKLNGDRRPEVFRVRGRDEPTPEPEVAQVGVELEKWLGGDAPVASRRVPNPVGAGELSVLHMRLGSGPETGMVVAGSRRGDFPTPVESLLLRMAVNEVLVRLQAAQIRAVEERSADIRRAKEQLEAENSYLRQECYTDQHWGELVGNSRALKDVLRLVQQVAPTTACVLIQGETGTGKELVARAIHYSSPRRTQPFVRLNCASIPAGLLESELFGHERGAFTGAIARHSGRFELADRGTLFLDEVGDLPLPLQVKLLRVLQEREFERLGGTRTIRVNVRVVAATNRDLAQMVAAGEFRSDLYYRLRVFPIVVPPLRDRVEDIPMLVTCFMERHARRCNKPICRVSDETMRALCRYAWPGNVRELENLIERSVIISQKTTLEVPLGELELDSREVTEVDQSLQGMEREHILRALQASNWVIAGSSGAAVRLGLKRTSLQYKMQKLGISRPR